jgi:hypothetical protein
MKRRMSTSLIGYPQSRSGSIFQFEIPIQKIADILTFIAMNAPPTPISPQPRAGVRLRFVFEALISALDLRGVASPGLSPYSAGSGGVASQLARKRH